MITVENQPSRVEKVDLDSPDVQDCRLEAVFAKVKPYRVGGIRLQHEQLDGKHIFHNYGHGSSGVSLAYGSSFMSVRSTFTYVKEQDIHKCAVIGSGLIGLLTANQLAKSKHNVTIYSRSLKHKGCKNILTSRDDGLFLPFGYDSSNKLQYQLLAKITYDFYKECLKLSRYQSIKTGTVYDNYRSLQDLKKIVPGFIFNGYKNVQVNYKNGKSQQCLKFKTFKINMRMFIEELRTEAILRGVKFVEKEFQSIEQIKSLNQDLIYNCTGYGSKKLFNDEKVKGCVDHIVLFKNPKNLNFTINTKLSNDIGVRIHCQNDEILIRSEKLIQIKDVDKKFVKQVVEQSLKFLNEKSNQFLAKL